MQPADAVCRCIADTLAQRAHRACVLTRLPHMHECRFHSRTDPFAPCTAREGRAGARRACSILTCSISARAAAIRLLRLKSPPMTRAGSLLGGRCRYHRCQHSVLPAGLPASLIPPAIPAECTPVHAIGTPGPHPPGLLPVLSHPSNSQLRAWAWRLQLQVQRQVHNGTAHFRPRQNSTEESICWCGSDQTCTGSQTCLLMTCLF